MKMTTTEWLYRLLLELEGALAIMTPNELEELLQNKKALLEKHVKEYEKAILLILKLIGEDK